MAVVHIVLNCFKLYLRYRLMFLYYQTSVSDVLHAMGAIPSGFRPSTLAHKFKDGKSVGFSYQYSAEELNYLFCTYKFFFFILYCKEFILVVYMFEEMILSDQC